MFAIPYSPFVIRCAKVAERQTRLTADQLYPGSIPGLGFFGVSFVLLLLALYLCMGCVT